MELKPSAFAGSWYPASKEECLRSIRGFPDADAQGIPEGALGGIVPHAGWVYSGRIACRVIAGLASARPDADTVILFGAHMHPSSPAFVLGRGGVDTPFGPIGADEALARYLTDAFDGILSHRPDRFPDENTLELQYPFIRHFFPDASILACGVPPSDMAGRIGEAAIDGARALGRSVVVVGSTDMTHYGPNFGFEPAGSGAAAVDWVAGENDALAIRALAEMDVREIVSLGLDRQNMCCAGAAAAAAAACKKEGAAKGVCLDYATSYEISRSSSFVGYCGMVYA